MELLDTVKARKLAYYGHTMRKQGNCLEKEIMQGTMPGACRRGSYHADRPANKQMPLKTSTSLHYATPVVGKLFLYVSDVT